MKDLDNRKIIVSKCLLGVPCQYDGTCSIRQLEPSLIDIFKLDIIPVCPEELSGLPTPRDPAEIQGGDGFNVIAGTAKVICSNGRDVTNNYIEGAEKTLEIINKHKLKTMISRRRSPSCSCNQIFDGTFSRKLIDGIGVTTALLHSNSDIQVIEIEEFVGNKFESLLNKILEIYINGKNWLEKQATCIDLIKNSLPIQNTDVWEDVFIQKFKEFIPTLHKDNSHADSDTVRFFEEAFRKAYKIELINVKKRCKICTYPDGFLDTYIMDDGICSACHLYNKNKSILEDFKTLKNILRNKILEVKGDYLYDAIVAFSGGKDSTFLTYQLMKEYQLKLLCVMDDLHQQNDLAIENSKNIVKKLGVDLEIIEPPSFDLEIRKNFLLADNHFCRLCLRTHFIRIYNLALEKKIPLIFYGFSPYQVFDCNDSIIWSLNSINDVSTPFKQLDHGSIIERYKHRSFQGGFDVGFISDEQKKLLKEWESVFSTNNNSFTPLIIPFFIFNKYPEESIILDTINKELDWIKPDILLNRTNCRMLKPAGIIHRVIGKYHLNYKERATKLRINGHIIKLNEISEKAKELNKSDDIESMTYEELDEFLEKEFNLKISSLSEKMKKNLMKILK